MPWRTASGWLSHAQTEVVIILRSSCYALEVSVPESNPATSCCRCRCTIADGMSSLSSAVFWRYAVSLIRGNIKTSTLWRRPFCTCAWKSLRNRDYAIVIADLQIGQKQPQLVLVPSSKIWPCPALSQVLTASSPVAPYRSSSPTTPSSSRTATQSTTCTRSARSSSSSSSLVVSPPLNTAPCVWTGFVEVIVRHAALADCNPVLSFAHTVIFLSPVQHCSVPIVSHCRRLRTSLLTYPFPSHTPKLSTRSSNRDCAPCQVNVEVALTARYWTTLFCGVRGAQLRVHVRIHAGVHVDHRRR